MRVRNPISEREINAANRSLWFVILILGFQLVMMVLALVVFGNMLQMIGSYGEEDYSLMLQLYLILAMVEAALILVILPGMAGASICSERERQTLAPMYAAGLTSADLVIGKLRSCMNLVLFLILSSFPMLSLVFVYGGIQLVDLISMVFVLLVLAFYLAALSILCSAWCKRGTSALIVSYVTALFLGGGTLLIHFFPMLLSGGLNYGDAIGSPIAAYHYLLLWNPVITFYAMMNQQAGSRRMLFDLINYQGNYQKNWVTENWVAVSLLVQVVTALLAIAAAIVLLEQKRKHL